jgi:hypothetical protein
MKLDYLTPSREVQASVDEANAALAACQETSDALDRITAETAIAQGELEAAVALRAALLAERAKQTDPAKIRAFEPRLKELSAAMAEANLNVESAAVAAEALEAELSQREGVIEAMQQAGVPAQVQAAYAGAVAADLGRRVSEALEKHLVPLMLEADALRDGTMSRAIGDWLNDLVLPRIGATSALYAQGYINFDGSPHSRLSQLRTERPELMTLATRSGEVRNAVDLVSRYVPRKKRMATVAPYQRRGYTTLGKAGEARFDEAAAAAEAAAVRAQARQRQSLGSATHQGSDVPPQADARGSGQPGFQALDDPDLAQFR